MSRLRLVTVVAALALSASARGEGDVEHLRCVLDAPPPAGRVPAATAVATLREALDRAGWRGGQPADVTVQVRWSFVEPEDIAAAGTARRATWCALVTLGWWDGSESARRVCVDGPLYNIDPRPPAAGTLAAALSAGVLEALRADVALRWTLRATGAAVVSEHAAFRVGSVDATPLVRRSGDQATLSVPRGATVAVTVGGCRVDAAERDAVLDLSRIGAERRIAPRWTVDGHEVRPDRIPRDRSFMLELLAPDAPPGGAGAVTLPCAGGAGLSAELVASGFEVTALTTAAAPFGWTVRAKEAAGSLRVSLRTPGSGAALWSASVTVSEPLVPRLWRALKAALGELGAMVALLTTIALGVGGLIRAVQPLLKHGRGSSGGGEAPPAPGPPAT